MPPSPHHLLLLDDEPEAHLLTAAILTQLDGPKWTMDSAHTCEEALERAATGRYELFLVDYYLQGETGLDFLQAARALGTKVPMIMLTAHGDRDLDLHAMEAGASDYLVKGELNPRTLDRSIRYVRRTSHGRGGPGPGAASAFESHGQRLGGDAGRREARRARDEGGVERGGGWARAGKLPGRSRDGHRPWDG